MTAQVLPIAGELLTPRTAAERLGPSVTTQQIYRWVKSGKLRAFRPVARGAIRIAVDDLRAFIAAHMTTPPPTARRSVGQPRPGGDISDLMPASGRRF